MELSLLLLEKRIYDFHCAVQAFRLEIFAHESLQTVVLGVGPQVCVEPVQRIGRCAAQSEPYDCLVRIENHELVEKLFCFSTGDVGRLDRIAACGWSRHCCHELHDGLVCDANRVILDAISEQTLGFGLLVGKPWIEAVHDDVGIN